MKILIKNQKKIKIVFLFLKTILQVFLKHKAKISFKQKSKMYETKM